MHAILIHNPTAGEGDVSADALLGAIERSGLDAEYRSKKDDDAFDGLQDADVLFLAGGDGTVARAALALRTGGPPLVLFASGTANNIARCFGVHGLPLQQAARLWRTGRRRKLDLCRLTATFVRAGFVEAAGVGPFGRLLVRTERGEEKEPKKKPADVRLDHARRRIRKLVEAESCRPLRLEVDGHAVHGDFLFASALNIGSIGPRLDVTAGADPGDGLLDLATVTTSQRDAFIAWLDAGAATGAFPGNVRRALTVSLDWDPDAGQLDGSAWPQDGEDVGRVELGVTGEQVEVFTP